ncbi:MAG: substrate-binding domain-containing protein [Candidatus Hodarchaeales archaeon]
MDRYNTMITLLVLFLGLFFGIAFLNVVNNDDYKTITLATTTSTENSGLLDYLHPYMTEETGIKVDIVAIGTGAAIEYAKRGLADVVMVHARSLEDQFVADGYGIHRIDLMYNDFVILGPIDDPANISGLTNSTEIFGRLYAARENITFVSRGDNSGTHIKELYLWQEAGITINGSDSTWAKENDWYMETGSGMAATINVAWVSSGYTLSDRGTWLFNEKEDTIEILAEGATEWRNPYGVILVNPNKFNETVNIKFDLAKAYVKWLISEKGQDLINNYKINGQNAFFADFQNHLNDMSQEELDFWGISPP